MWQWLVDSDLELIPNIPLTALQLSGISEIEPDAAERLIERRTLEFFLRHQMVKEVDHFMRFSLIERLSRMKEEAFQPTVITSQRVLAEILEGQKTLILSTVFNTAEYLFCGWSFFSLAPQPYE